MPNYRNDSRSRSEEQWELVGTYRRDVPGEVHAWRLRLFRNSAGKHRTGLKCLVCGEEKVFTLREERQMDARPGRGEF